MTDEVSREITLVEYGPPERAVPLSQEARDALGRFPFLTLSPTPGTASSYDISALGRVGTLLVGDIYIIIQPKVPIRTVLFLISYALNPRDWDRQSFPYATNNTLFDAIVHGMVHQVRQLLRRGLLANYVSLEETSPVMRGQLRPAAQLTRHPGLPIPLELHIDDYTLAIPENMLIKSALQRLRMLPMRASSTRSALHEVLQGFESVPDILFSPNDLPVVRYDSRNSYYRASVELARWVLRNSMFDLRSGTVHASTFTVNMADIFETFVVTGLQEALGIPSSEWTRGALGRLLTLDREKRVRLQPDFSWWIGRRCVALGDVKYKKTEWPGVVHPDLYQVLAYMIAAELKHGTLVYPSGEAVDQIHQIRTYDAEVHVRTLPLDGEPDEILGRLRLIATEVAAEQQAEPFG